MNVKSTFLMPLAFLLVSACGDQGNGTVPIGTKLPGGYTVTESVMRDSMSDCISYAENVQGSLHVKSKNNTSDDKLYTAALILHDGSEILQICTTKSKSNVVYSSAKK